MSYEHQFDFTFVDTKRVFEQVTFLNDFLAYKCIGKHTKENIFSKKPFYYGTYTGVRIYFEDLNDAVLLKLSLNQ